MDKTSPMKSKPLVDVTCKLGIKGCFEDGRCHALGNCENKIVTNADRIRAMSDEELARWMCGGSVSSGAACTYCDKNNGEFCNGEKCRSKTDTEIIEEWLKQPAEVDNG